MKRRLFALIALSLLTVAPLAMAGTVRAFLDRTQVTLGETVTLNVEATDATDAKAPDFDVLLPDFVIAGRNLQQNINTINGKRTLTQIWAVALQPRRAGTLTIPAFDVGGQRTDPITLAVAASAGGSAHGDVFLEYEAEPARAWVGQEVVLRVRLFYAGNLAQGQLDEPKSVDADVRKLGDDIHYQAQRGGRMYRVVERRYALFAQHPGQLHLAALSFRGQMQEPGYGGFFGAGRAVSTSSAALDLVIDPIPAHGGGDWLPARSLSLTASGLPTNGKAMVGQPLTLTLTVKAEGLPYEALPEPELPPLDGAAVYPDKPVDLTRNDGQWLSGRRERKFAIVPSRPGQLTVPAITLSWWNTDTGKLETASVPAQTLQVAAAAGTTTPTSPPSVAVTPGAAATSTTADAIQPAEAPVATGWRLAAVILLALWVITLLAWVVQARRNAGTRKPKPVAAVASPDASSLRRAFRGSIDAASLARTLLAWARSERPHLHNLGQLAAALQDDEQRQAIDSLERQRFAGGDAVDVASVIKAFRSGFAWYEPIVRHDDGGLPPLYPPA